MPKFFREKNTKEEALEKLRQMEWVRNKQDSWHLSRFVNCKKIESYDINVFHFVAEALLSSFGQITDLAHPTVQLTNPTAPIIIWLLRGIGFSAGHL